jgi:CoA:oxalate CoA-transferase
MRYFATGEVPQPLGTRHPAATPFQAFSTKDGYIVLAVSWGVENQWELFCAVIERSELINDERFDTPHARTANHAELEPLLNDAMSRRTTAEWLKEFDAIGLPCGPLNNIAQAAALPQVRAREMLVEVEHPVIGKLPLAGTPVKLSRTTGGIRGPSPSLGQHTNEVLQDLAGLSNSEIEWLREGRVVQ